MTNFEEETKKSSFIKFNIIVLIIIISKFLKSKVSRMMQRIKLIFSFLHSKIKKPFKAFIVIAILFFLVLNVISFVRGNLSGVSGQLEYYVSTLDAYRKLTGEEIHDMWNKKYHDTKYKWDGNSKYNEYDCTSAVYWFLKDLKSNFQLMSVKQLESKLNQSSYKRKSYNEVQVGDLIVFYVNSSNWHIGIVDGKGGDGQGNLKIKYCAMDVVSTGAAYGQISFGSSIVKGIYPMTLDLWIGDLLKKYGIGKEDQPVITKNVELKKEVVKIQKQKDIEKK